MNINRNALLLYLRDLRDLEIAKRKINTLYFKEKNFVDNQLANIRTLDLKVEDNKTDYSTYLISMGFGLGMGILFWNWSKNWAADFFSQIVSLCLKIFAGVGFLVFAIGLLLLIYDFFATSNANKEASKHNASEIARVNSNTNKALKLEHDWKVRSAYLKNELTKVDSLLTSYYNQNILPKQYRTLPSLIYIYDYMSSSQENLTDTLIHEHMENGIQKILNKLVY